jgi:hypothetical protein
MHIDKSHRSWSIISLLILLTGAVGYWTYVRPVQGVPKHPHGGSWQGLVFGSIGSAFILFAFILFAVLIGVRKRVRTWRVGRAEFWMRGHLWLGTLALPFIWFHGGFHHGGRLTGWLMMLLYLVVITGWIGAVIQHFLPIKMMSMVRNETIYEQIPRVIQHLAIEADEIAAICGPDNGENIDAWREKRRKMLATRQERALLTKARRRELEDCINAAPVQGSGPLKELYVNHIEPFLKAGKSGGAVLQDEIRSESLFAQRKLLIPEDLHEQLAELERICGEVRQLHRQRRMHFWLHSWLLIHAPASVAIVVLGIVHAIVALRW